MNASIAPFKSAMRRIYAGRPHLPYEQKTFKRVEKVPGGDYVEIWFLTGGCSWDADGGCTMCNYGKGHKVSAGEIVAAVGAELEAHPGRIHELMISPSGSMLDETEVPPEALEGIIKMAGEKKAGMFLFETRAETITAGKIEEVLRLLGGTRLGVEMGLESCDPLVRKYCVNKSSGLEEFERAVSVLKESGVRITANVSLGTAFLDAREAVEDAVRTVEWAFEKGVDAVVLFPLHIKPHTMLEWLSRNGYYEQVSLWSLVMALSKVSRESLSRTHISWYRNYYKDSKKVISSPSTCPECCGRVLDLLDEYRKTCSREVVDRLNEITCRCRAGWNEKLNSLPVKSLENRIIEAYSKMELEFL